MMSLRTSDSWYLVLNALLIMMMILMLVMATIRCRSSRPELFYKKGVLKNFAKLTWKHLYQILRSTFLLKRVNFAKSLRATFVIEQLWWLLMKVACVLTKLSFKRDSFRVFESRFLFFNIFINKFYQEINFVALCISFDWMHHIWKHS